MMNSIYNNIKGVFAAICMMSMFFFGYSCSQGTDEEIIDQKLDSSRMHIQPLGCIYYLDDTLDNRPDEMVFLVSRALKTWRSAFIVDFKENRKNYIYQGDFNLSYGAEENNENFVIGKYHAISFSYDTKSFDYGDMYGFLYQNNVGVTQIKLPYNVNASNVVENPKVLYMSYLDNYEVTEIMNDSANDSRSRYFEMDTRLLTQRYEWTFTIKKTDSIARVDAVEAEISGIPCSVELRSEQADASSVVTGKVFGNFTTDTFDPGIVTVKLKIDALPIVAPSHAKVLQLVENEVGYMVVRMTITNKKGVSRDWLVRHRMEELDEEPIYDLLEDVKCVKKKEGVKPYWNYTIEDDILINLDTINTRRYGKWQVVK